MNGETSFKDIPRVMEIEDSELDKDYLSEVLEGDNTSGAPLIQTLGRERTEEKMREWDRQIERWERAGTSEEMERAAYATARFVKEIIETYDEVQERALPVPNTEYTSDNNEMFAKLAREHYTREDLIDHVFGRETSIETKISHGYSERKNRGEARK